MLCERCLYSPSSELQVRSYVGLAEGIVGSCVSVCFIIGFVVLNMPLIWIWVCWGLGIMAYNSYCIYDCVPVFGGVTRHH